MSHRLTDLSILPHSLAIWALGQMGYVFKSAGTTLAIDLCLSDYVQQIAGDFWARAYPPPIEASALDGIDLMCITHDHADHLDPLTVSALAQANPHMRFITTAWSKDKMPADIAPERILTPQVGETLHFAGVSIHPTLSAHYDTTQHPDKGYRWLGFLLEFDTGVKVYHAGDTILYEGYVPHLQQHAPIDIAILPVNGRDSLREAQHNIYGNLHPQEAAWLTQQMGWQTVLVGHNDLFANNAIPYGHIADAFAPLYPHVHLHTLRAGELYYYVKA